MSASKLHVSICKSDKLRYVLTFLRTRHFSNPQNLSYLAKDIHYFWRGCFKIWIKSSWGRCIGCVRFLIGGSLGCFWRCLGLMSCDMLCLSSMLLIGSLLAVLGLCRVYSTWPASACSWENSPRAPCETKGVKGRTANSLFWFALSKARDARRVADANARSG